MALSATKVPQSILALRGENKYWVKGTDPLEPAWECLAWEEGDATCSRFGEFGRQTIRLGNADT
jgi:hypothetical protein